MGEEEEQLSKESRIDNQFSYSTTGAQRDQKLPVDPLVPGLHYDAPGA